MACSLQLMRFIKRYEWINQTKTNKVVDLMAWLRYLLYCIDLYSMHIIHHFLWMSANNMFTIRAVECVLFFRLFLLYWCEFILECCILYRIVNHFPIKFHRNSCHLYVGNNILVGCIWYPYQHNMRHLWYP